MDSKLSKAEMIENLREMLRDVFHLRSGGVAYARLARAHGYVDGYMRVLLETGVCQKSELLQVVAEEREVVSGPSTGVLQPEAAA